jgi:hypothetical protein
MMEIEIEFSLRYESREEMCRQSDPRHVAEKE